MPAMVSASSIWPLPSTPASARTSPDAIDRLISCSATPPSRAGRRMSSQREQRGARRNARRGCSGSRDVATDHQARELRLGRARGRHSPDRLAVAQHDDLVADLEHLVQLVGDEDDRFALGSQPAHHLEQAGHLGRAQVRRRLVQHEEIGAAQDGFEDLDALPAAERQPADLRRRDRDRDRSARWSRAAARATAARRSQRPAARQPSITLSATVMASTSMKCWWIMPMPAAIASPGVWSESSRPLKMIPPLSGAIIPNRIFIKVLLPEPFSPRRPTIWPRRHIEADAGIRAHTAERLDDVAHLEERLRLRHGVALRS